MYVTGGADGMVKVWNRKKQLVREIKFPEPISSVCFLNENADVLVGHVGKVSSVSAQDYKPFESKSLAQPSDEDFQEFIKTAKRPVNRKHFYKLKIRDEEIKAQVSKQQEQGKKGIMKKGSLK